MTYRLSAFRAAAALLLLAPAPAAAQALPPAARIIDRYVEAIGGREAQLAPRSLSMHGTFSMPAMGLSGAFDMVQVQPNGMKMRIELPGVGEILTGFDGETGWSVNPMIGPVVFEGDRLAQTREESGFLGGLRDASMFRSRETVGESESQGEACWQVKLVWKSGRETTDCYGKDSGLLLQTSSATITDMGTAQTTMLFSEYRAFDGRRYPTRMVQQVMGQEHIMTIDSVAFNAVDAAALALPEAIRTLLNK